MRAPIVIPTLNRYEHLKECLESLKRNNQACETEVYISVDYPCAEKYIEGYNKIKEYLDAGIDGFKDVKVFYQQENLGPLANSAFLKKEAYKSHEAFIYTEDDNVFSKDFLEYMNTCLEKYKNDDSVFSINGYAMPIKWQHKEGMIKHNLNFSAWGYACWNKKYDERLTFDGQEIIRYLKKFSNAKKFCKVNGNFFANAIEIARGTHYLAYDKEKKLLYIDTVICILMHIRNQYVVAPLISKVRNNGHDGSGQNCVSADTSKNNNPDTNTYDYEKQELSTKDSFVYENETVYDADYAYEKAMREFFPEKKINMIKAWIKWYIYIKLHK